MKQKETMNAPNYEQLPMQIHVKIYRPSVRGPSWRMPRST